MKKGLILLGLVGIGSTLAYVLDPKKGARRRAHLRDQVTHLAKKGGAALRQKLPRSRSRAAIPARSTASRSLAREY